MPKLAPRAQKDRTVAVLAALAREPLCTACGKPTSVCLCDKLPKDLLPSRIRVVILQHPQEGDAVLGTAPIVARMVAGATVVPGLSWPSLEKALGVEKVDRARWAVLFSTPRPKTMEPQPKKEPVVVLDRNLQPRPRSAPRIEGIVVLDGTWSHAKTLWWRNPWLLKLNRISLIPREPSMYGSLRAEPRRECVSTLEAIADVLPALGEPEELRNELRRVLRTLLQRVRDRIAPATM